MTLIYFLLSFLCAHLSFTLSSLVSLLLLLLVLVLVLLLLHGLKTCISNGKRMVQSSADLNINKEGICFQEIERDKNSWVWLDLLQSFLPDYATTFIKFKQNPWRKKYYLTETAKFVTCHRTCSDSILVTMYCTYVTVMTIKRETG